MSCFEDFKYSSSYIPKSNSFYLIFWGGVMSLLTISFMVHDSYCYQEWGILNPSISLLELSSVRFHLKPSLRNIANYGAINDPSFLLSSRRKKFSSLLWSQTSNCFLLVAEFHFKRWDVSISPLQVYSFRCWFSNNSIITFLEGCFPSSFVAEVAFSSPFCYSNDISSIIYFFRRHCDVALFTHLLGLWGPCFFSCLSI